jgi:dihydroxyacid dehydratase/phosphogluconate dehydratase
MTSLSIINQSYLVYMSEASSPGKCDLCPKREDHRDISTSPASSSPCKECNNNNNNNHCSWCSFHVHSTKTPATHPSHLGSHPIIAIIWSGFNPCNGHLRELAESVSNGIREAGGFPLEAPVFATVEFCLRPTAMLYRNLCAIER